MASRHDFARAHASDGRAVALCAGIVFVAIAGGFAYDMATISSPNPFTYRWYTHVHAVAFSAWLLLFVGQVALVRTGNTALHRRIGRAGFWLVPILLFAGPLVAILHRHDTPISPYLSFMATQFTNVIGCTTLLAAGLVLRRDPATHKRLMLLGTIAITEPGFSRIWGDPLAALLGNGYIPYYVSTYIGTAVLVLAMGAYDLATRGRLHPAYVIGSLWIFANEAMATWLYYQPFWFAWMKALTGH